MANIEIYTKATCSFCHHARALLNSKGVSFQELSIDGDAVKHEGMIKRSSRTTVLRTFIDAQHIGGCDDLYALGAHGGLDLLLRQGAPKYLKDDTKGFSQHIRTK